MTTMEENRSTEDWQLKKSCVRDRFKELLKLSLWTDCSFSVGAHKPEVIRCHKLVLAASSPVFEASFYGNFPSSEEAIRVPDVEPSTFRTVLRYLYADDLDLYDIEEAGAVLYVAKKYMLPQLVEHCVEYICLNTRIDSLSLVLQLGETLDEEELVAAALKVMCLHPWSVWMNQMIQEGYIMSSAVMSRLLDQKCLNMTEPELWTFLMNWIDHQCTSRSLVPNPENKRKLMLDINAFSKIRFLVFKKEDFNSLVVGKGILSFDEIDMLNAGISYVQSFGSSEDISIPEVPEGFCNFVKPRIKLISMTWRCSREVLGRGNTWIYGGTLETGLMSTSRVLVIGFEVFTRVLSFENAHGQFSNPCKDIINNIYRERLIVSIIDQDGNLLLENEHVNTAEFNSTQEVRLLRPIWFAPHTRYTVEFRLPAGQYPLCQLTDSVTSKGTTFKFFDDSQTSGFHQTMSFVNSVLYTL